MAVFDALNIDNDVFRGFITWGGLLLIKLLFMALLTSFERVRKGAVPNPEDVVMQNDEVKIDPDVERTRRAHLNDLENIPAFLIAGFFYVMTEPHREVALWLIRIAVIARIVHTFVYAIYPTQPARVICFSITFLITLFMIGWSMVYFFQI